MSVTFQRYWPEDAPPASFIAMYWMGFPVSRILFGDEYEGRGWEVVRALALVHGAHTAVLEPVDDRNSRMVLYL